MLLSCKNIQKSFGETEVLRDISLLLEEGEKAALIGVNGAGKTTLFKILTGMMSADVGELALKKGATIGYMAQMNDLDPEASIYDALLDVFAPLIELERELRELEQQMAGCEGAELKALMDKYARLNSEFELKDGFSYQSRLRGMLNGLGFQEHELELKIASLSGGQKTRVMLGKMLLQEPDLLLLDEPTNHLDIASITWLEDNFLKNYKGAAIIISHDRYFLDKTASKIIEIEHGKSKTYNGNYTYYAYKKETDRALELKHYLDQQKVIKKQEETIRVLRSFNREKSIKRAESREKLLAKMERLDRPEALPEAMHITLTPPRPSGKDVLIVENISKSFDGVTLFENASMTIQRGENVALIGPNGIGKTTLLRMIMKGQADSGIIRLGTNVEIGYYDQEHAQLSLDKTLFDELADTYPRLTNLEIRNALAAFMFTGDDVFKPISSLSGGEKGRVALCKMMLGNVNFIILDEPTNHLDMQSREVLEETLRNYEGTVLYVSHDRYFINSTADRILELSPEGMTSYLGNYDYYVEKRGEQPKQQEADEEQPSAENDWKRRKEEQAEERKRQNRIKRLEEQIAKFEEQIAALDEELAREEVYTNAERAHEAYQKKTVMNQELEAFYVEWESLQS